MLFKVAPTKGRVMLTKLLQPSNKSLPKAVIVAGSDNSVNAVQFAKAPVLIFLSEEFVPKVMLIRPVQLKKAYDSITVIESATITLTKSVQFSKAPVPIVVTGMLLYVEGIVA